MLTQKSENRQKFPGRDAAESLAQHERYSGAPLGGLRHSGLRGFTKKSLSHLEMPPGLVPLVRRGSGNAKALCLPWLRKELAFGLRDKSGGAKTAGFSLSGRSRI